MLLRAFQYSGTGQMEVPALLLGPWRADRRPAFALWQLLPHVAPWVHWVHTPPFPFPEGGSAGRGYVDAAGSPGPTKGQMWGDNMMFFSSLTQFGERTLETMGALE